MNKKPIERAIAILKTPRTEWPIIETETTSTADLYQRYVLLIALVPAICALLGMGFLGGSFFVRLSLIGALLGFALALVMVYVLALIIDALAPRFGAQKNRAQALKTSAYSYTAIALAGVGQLVPTLASLIMLAGAAYTVYLLHLALPITMKAPPERATSYTGAVVVCGIVASIVLGAIVAGIAGRGYLYGMPGFR